MPTPEEFEKASGIGVIVTREHVAEAVAKGIAAIGQDRIKDNGYLIEGQLRGTLKKFGCEISNLAVTHQFDAFQTIYLAI